jgi:hypothetical protein
VAEAKLWTHEPSLEGDTFVSHLDNPRSKGLILEQHIEKGLDLTCFVTQGTQNARNSELAALQLDPTTELQTVKKKVLQSLPSTEDSPPQVSASKLCGDQYMVAHFDHRMITVFHGYGGHISVSEARADNNFTTLLNRHNSESINYQEQTSSGNPSLTTLQFLQSDQAFDHGELVLTMASKDSFPPEMTTRDLENALSHAKKNSEKFNSKNIARLLYNMIVADNPFDVKNICLFVAIISKDADPHLLLAIAEGGGIAEDMRAKSFLDNLNREFPAIPSPERTQLTPSETHSLHSVRPSIA